MMCGKYFKLYVIINIYFKRPVISWSSVDYYGEWKGVHYRIRNMYEEILVVIRESTKNR